MCDNFISEVLDLNSKNITWKTKLEFVNNLIGRHKSEAELQKFPTFATEGLAILATYLYFINSGHISCGDQGHFRPNHQAGFSYSIFKMLDHDFTIVSNL